MEVYRKFSLISAVIVGIFIFYISSLEFPPSPFYVFSYITIIYHFSMFFLFSFFLLISGKFEKRFILVVLPISLAYACLDELHQFFVPGRDPSFFDVGIDFAGSLAGFLILSLGFLLGKRFNPD